MSLNDGRPWEGDGDLPWDSPDGTRNPPTERRGGGISTSENGRKISPVPSTGSTRSSRAMNSGDRSGS